MSQPRIPAMDLRIGSVVSDRGRVTLHRLEGAPARVIVRYEGDTEATAYAPTEQLAITTSTH